jgi:D-serine deaminase-like pyridoxal phosphate-dependent protein
MFENLLTPRLLLDVDCLDRNIQRMQAACDAHGVALWPHIKTHKMVEVAQRQLAAGAKGLTCAKVGEAQAMLPSGVRSIFLAHSLVDPLQGPRLCALDEALDELIVACTSEAQGEALERVLASVNLRLPVLMGVDTGNHREGVRTVEEAARLADFIRRQPHMTLRGIYTHEGHAYRAAELGLDAVVADVHARLLEFRDRIDPTLELWPGSSVTAAVMAAQSDITAVRPGTYVFGDLALAVTIPIMAWDDLAVTILATVVDRPEPGLALLDAGSKTFFSDKTPKGLSGSFYDRRDIHVPRCNEEHGYAVGSQVDELRVGERVRVVPAHICPVINLADEVTVIQQGKVIDTWRVAARGCVY